MLNVMRPGAHAIISATNTCVAALDVQDAMPSDRGRYKTRGRSTSRRPSWFGKSSSPVAHSVGGIKWTLIIQSCKVWAVWVVSITSSGSKLSSLEYGHAALSSPIHGMLAVAKSAPMRSSG